MITFDNPGPSYQNYQYADRYSLLLHDNQFADNIFTVSLNCAWHNLLDVVQILTARMKCFTHKQVETKLKQVLEDGGEGVVLRKPGSVYEHGRSSSLLKIKV